MMAALGWLTVWAFFLLTAMALYDYLVASVQRWWNACLAKQLAPQLAAALESARREHQDARAWLIETHRMEVERIEARVQQRITEAVVDAMTSRAPHPLRDVA